MTDLQTCVAPTFLGLADLLASAPPATWDTPSLCAGWGVRHVVAHMTMAGRLTPEQFGAEMAAAGGDFDVLSDTVAARDARLPLDDLLAGLRSPSLHAWQPPGGGAAGALGHAVIHSLDATIPLDAAPTAPPDALHAILDHLTAAHGTIFGLDLTGLGLRTPDGRWTWGDGDRIVEADAHHMVALLAGRTLPDGRVLGPAREAGRVR
ncbi:maleylpyruvate isomerase family mycothiol-dependent enzyme [Pseudonocardia ailaonensis]|uniref:Maleylpyruvate isomerase family mycothiol-dependent enzyme n=1 Tax=Pseudonocardia ailaonensis TaxID=367279 RepID=A0ABN2NED5_9PSEU